MVGPDGGVVSAEDVRQHWRNTLKNFSEAKIYLLDHNAANYLDTLRMDVQGMPWEEPPEGGIERYVEEVDFPRDLVWVEYDDRRLWEDRIQRGLLTQSEQDLDNRDQRGFLFDNRSADTFSVRLFHGETENRFFDAPLVLEMPISEDGHPDFSNPTWQPQTAVIADYMLRGGLNADSARGFFDEYKGHLFYEMVIGFMLFAALASREDDLRSQETASLTTAEAKTARKFGKTWMAETLKSHVTVRIGPAGERHVSEQKARRQFEAAQASGRATPTEHWVAEHERKYSNGKIVRVRAHKRGQSAPRDLPTRVVGPRRQG